jgi:hypothetical protein
MNQLQPSVGLLCKLGSIVVLVDEGLSIKGDHFDVETIKNLLNDPELKEWLAMMDRHALIPKKR